MPVSLSALVVLAVSGLGPVPGPVTVSALPVREQVADLGQHGQLGVLGLLDLALLRNLL